ncbi:MAG: GNAT family N-acetyltransferase [Acidimicrobiia bacterium]|nr:GNAT family N-acetyltransferase [Acidimicrobiia bacterium]
MEDARAAVPADLDAVEEVAQRVAAGMVGLRGGELLLAAEVGRGSLRDRMARAIDAPDTWAVVGCYDGVVLGWALAVVETLPDGRRLGVIESIAVDPEARAAGIGEAMMDLVLRELARAGCIGADARALPGDRETKNFFESFGLKARLLTVHRTFLPDPIPDGPDDGAAVS